MKTTSSTRNRPRILVIALAALLVVGAIIAAVVFFTPRPMSSDMPGMKHASVIVPLSPPTPTMTDDMAGMDHGSAEVPGKAHDEPAPGKKHDDGAPGSPWKTPEHSHAVEVEVVPDQPLAAVLGTFGVGSGAVMISAGVLRHRDRARIRVKAAARAARRSQA